MLQVDKVLFDANKVLTRLSKVRVVKSSNSIEQKSFVKIHPWPLCFDRNRDLLEYLKSKNIPIIDSLFANGIQIGYSNYEKLEKIEFNIDNIRYLRNQIKLLRIRSQMDSSDETGLIIAHDPERSDESKLPRSTNDIDLIRNLDSRSDVIYLFNSKHTDWREKIQGYLGTFVFTELEWFRNHSFTNTERDAANSKAISRGTRANRIVIENTSNFQKVIDETEKNVNSIMPSNDWNERLKELTINHYELKRRT